MKTQLKFDQGSKLFDITSITSISICDDEDEEDPGFRISVYSNNEDEMSFPLTEDNIKSVKMWLDFKLGKQ